MDTLLARDVDGYLARFPEDTQRLLKQLRQSIRKLVPDASEKIAFGMPTFYLNGNLVHYAAFERHIGFFPGAPAIAAFKDEIAGLTFAAGSVQFPLDKPLPLGLVSRIIKFRVKQVQPAQGSPRAAKKPAAKKAPAAKSRKAR